MSLVERIVLRVLARNERPKTPAINREKDRVVYVLPETLEEESGKYEPVPPDTKNHIMNKGKPRRPSRPRKPKKPHKPEIPRGTTPAPVRPPRHPRPVLPVPPVPPVKPVKPVKDPSPTDEPRRWKLRKPKPLQANDDIEARVLTRFLRRTHDR